MIKARLRLHPPFLAAPPALQQHGLNMLDGLGVVRGEKRVLMECAECGKWFAHRYVPYGLGRGRQLGGCICIAVSHNAYCKARRVATVMREGEL